MTTEAINVIIRSDGNDPDFYATSPQAPGLVFGRRTTQDLRAELQDVLSFHFGRPGPFDMVVHHERHFEIADGELVTRMALDGHAEDRRAVYMALGRAAGYEDQASGLLAAPPNMLGEVVYVCTVMSDTLGWIVNQLDPRGDTINIAVSVADIMIFTTSFTYNQHREGMVAINTKSYDFDTTISQVVREIGIVKPTSRAEEPPICV
ncbi:Rossmann-fold NAD(P)-binding domain-containing protein [Sphaerimonospora thailandensis]|uniref:hypothetical protein n=1 Tax=Sphaerimonospora thailandensis TaxID=795644 RepID=UPI001950530F|nr:hypothetical protein [Sphaerimonospora thailandensis]